MAMAGLFAGSAFAQSTPPMQLQRMTSGAGESYAGAGAMQGAPEPLEATSRIKTNYGRPQKAPDKRLGYSGRRKPAVKQPANPLPALVPYARASAGFITAAPDAAAGASADPAPPPTSVAQGPGLPPPQRPRLDETPYAPVGVDAAGLWLVPFVEGSTGFDSNPNRIAQPAKGSAVARVDAGFAGQSDWSRHEARVDVKGAYSRYLAAPEASRPEGTGAASMRVDISRDTSADFQLRGSLTSQRPGAPGVPVDLVNRPWVATFGVTGGMTQKFGRMDVSAAALVDRTNYQDGKLNTGATAAFSRDSYAAYGFLTRIAFEATPGVIPFIEAQADQRVHDHMVDASGYLRNSLGGSARVGSKFEITRTLTGDLAAGYGQRRYDDARLPLLAGPLLDGALVWSASPLTTITARAVTTFAETTLAGVSGGLSRSASLGVSHALLRNLTLGADASLLRTDYRGMSLSQTTWTGTLSAEYSLSRSMVLKGSYAHEQLLASSAGAGYSADVFLLGLRLQR